MSLIKFSLAAATIFTLLAGTTAMSASAHGREYGHDRHHHNHDRCYNWYDRYGNYHYYCE